MNWKDGRFRVQSFSPSGFMRIVNIKLKSYLLDPSQVNENALGNAWKQFLWEWGGTVPRPPLDDVSALNWTFLPKVDGQTFYNQNLDGRLSSHGPARVNRVMPQLTTSSPEIFNALAGTFCALTMDNPSRFRSSRHSGLLYFAASILYRASARTTTQDLQQRMEAIRDTNRKSTLVTHSTSKFLAALKNMQAHAIIVVSCHSKFDETLVREVFTYAMVESVVDKYVAMLERLTVNFVSYKVDAILESATETFSVLRQHWMSKEEARQYSWTHLPARLYTSFMRVGYVLDRPQFSKDIWKMMIDSGIRPGLKQFTTAIKGAGNVKDARQVELLWSMMLRSGLHVDDQAWTSRIGATLQTGKFSIGLGLLREWGELLEGNKKDGPKPSIFTLNVALSALTDAKHAINAQLIQDVLDWAAAKGIQADAFTCNILLSLFTKTGQIVPALDLLRQMKTNGVAPDVVTFTTLLNSLFSGKHDLHLSLEERDKIVLGIIELMESASVAPNDHLLAALVRGALSDKIDPTIADAVMKYAISGGKRIYGRLATVLLNFFFTEGNMDSVHVLWKELNTADLQADRYFFSRMVEGFAAAGELQYMAFFLNRMVKNGMSPTWCTLSSALSASTQQESRVIAERVIAEARVALSKGTLSFQENDPKQRLFLAIAHSYGLPNVHISNDTLFAR